MNFPYKSLVFAAASVVLSGAAVAGASVAQIDNAHGKVLINQGKGFVPVTGLMSLNAGDKIMVGEQSFATVSYGECTVSLSSPTVFSVSAKAPCIAGAELTAVDGAFIVPTDAPPEEAGALLPLLPLIFVGTGAAIVGGLIVSDVLSDNDESTGVTGP